MPLVNLQHRHPHQFEEIWVVVKAHWPTRMEGLTPNYQVGRLHKWQKTIHPQAREESHPGCDEDRRCEWIVMYPNNPLENLSLLKGLFE
ncbi:UNVERIFIED_CONTAM: hypothetical protein Slati_0497600 [Sesamum latifolium]|uniref:Uncharacterized protein n=1 Tax=Sesamum latifolium TaxID=2727402 RepID=A0AAW2XX51_9LAMI